MMMHQRDRYMITVSPEIQVCNPEQPTFSLGFRFSIHRSMISLLIIIIG